MPTPRERLTAIIANVRPSEVVFKAVPATGDTGRIVLEMTKKTSLTLVPSTDGLQECLQGYMTEVWSEADTRFIVNCTVGELFRTIVYNVVSTYDTESTRSEGTKRKTILFLKNITIDDEIANFVIAIYLSTRPDVWLTKSSQEQQQILESLEVLRRRYAK